MRELRQVCEALVDTPEAYPLVPRYERMGVRRRVWGNYLIFDRVAQDEIELLHVLHGARDYELLLFPER